MTTTFDTAPAPAWPDFRPDVRSAFDRMARVAQTVMAAFAEKRRYVSVQHLSDDRLRDIGLDPSVVRRFDAHRPTVHPYAF